MEHVMHSPDLESNNSTEAHTIAGVYAGLGFLFSLCCLDHYESSKKTVQKTSEPTCLFLPDQQLYRANPFYHFFTSQIIRRFLFCGGGILYGS